MLSWRAQRQVTALAILIVLVGLGLAFVVRRVLPPASCTDGRRNQGEAEVDCGGPCAPCELRNPRSVEVFWARAVPARASVYDVAAQIQNPNEVLSAPRVDYEFSLFDEVGQVARRTGHTFLLPQERTYVVETNIETNRAPRRVEFRILGVEWQTQVPDQPSIVAEKREYRVRQDGDRRSSSVESSVLNRSPFSFREVEVEFIVLDPDGNLLGANRVLVENLGSGSRQSVLSIWPEEFPAEPSVIEVEPRVNVFDPSILRRPE